MKKVLYAYKMLIVSLIFTSVTSVKSFAYRGGADGGHGGAMECPIVNSAGKVTMSYRLLDFWEAEKGIRPFEKKLSIPRSQLPVVTQIKNAIEKMKIINPDFANQIEITYQKILKNKKSVEDLAVEPPTDTLQPYLCRGGNRVGIGSYSDIDDFLSYDEVLLSKMSNTDQAGFWLHEAIYYLMRKSVSAENSVVTRLIVAQLFSTEKAEPLIRHRLEKSFICSRESYSFRESTGSQFYFQSSKFLLHTDGEKTIIVPIWVGANPTPNEYNIQLRPDDTTLYFWTEAKSIIDMNQNNRDELYNEVIKNYNGFFLNLFNGELTKILANTTNFLNQTIAINKLSPTVKSIIATMPDTKIREFSGSIRSSFIEKYNKKSIQIDFMQIDNKDGGTPVYVSFDGTVGLVSLLSIHRPDKSFNELSNEVFASGKSMAPVVTNCKPF